MAPAKKQKGFSTKAFKKEKFSPRTKDIDVPDLKDYFPEGEEPVWIIRGLDANEIAKCYDAQKTLQAIDTTFQAAAGAVANEEKVKEMREKLGIEIDVHSDIILRRAQLVHGSVLPEIDQQAAVKFSRVFPVEFYNITTEITRLTGLGQTPGKPKPSGKEET
jgi:hypothetical protein